MLRVLAGLGLTIGEFTHEIKQFQPSIQGSIHQLKNMSIPANGLKILDSLKQNFNELFGYTRFLVPRFLRTQLESKSLLICWR